MKRLICFLFLCSKLVFAYEINIDSLYKVYLNERLSDTIRLKSINQIVSHYHYSNPDSSMKLARNMLQLSRSLGAKKWEGIALNTIGFLYQNKYEYSNALKYNILALDLFEKINHRKGIASAESYIGITYKRIADYSKTRMGTIWRHLKVKMISAK